ncbi:MAG: hypothetical protein ACI88A_002410 [Paraglaciecola sp.]|jgi:hypothetical protein
MLPQNDGFRAGFKTIYAAVTTFDLDPLGLQIVTLPKWL